MLSKKTASHSSTRERLETPRSIGYHVGMTSSGIIARRLENLYALPVETPRRINELLETLNRTVGSDRSEA